MWLIDRGEREEREERAGSDGRAMDDGKLAGIYCRDERSAVVVVVVVVARILAPCMERPTVPMHCRGRDPEISST